MPIFKSGEPDNPKNYRGITLSSLLGKLFTTIINNRLYEFLTQNNIIQENQIGFQKGRRTTDHIFVLNYLIKQFKGQGKVLYACFIDLRKCFDTLWRKGIMYKLYKNGVSSKIVTLIKSMYELTKSRVKLENGYTSYFKNDCGSRQGCPLSPNLFNLYTNDLTSDILNDDCDAILLGNIKLNFLAFADD